MAKFGRKGPVCFGYNAYEQAKKEVFREAGTGRRATVNNEVDIIALSGMNATMVSCKTSDNDNMQWICQLPRP